MMKKEQLMTFYTEMLRIRLVEEKIVELYPEQEMRCPTHLCIGQEATPVGICQALAGSDYAFGNHRSHGHYLAKGGDMGRMIAEIYGREDGCAGGKGGSMHLIDLSCGFMGAVPIVGATLPLATGAALASQMKGDERVTVAFFGDAATEEGVFYESVNFAAIKKLPIVFVCENNLYSTHTTLEDRRPKNREIHEIASAFGIHCASGNGNDVEEVYKYGSHAIDLARSGKGPSFLEFSTYRWLEHCGPNDDRDLGYRSGKEIDDWKKKCPIVAFEMKHKISKEDMNQVRQEVNAEVDQAFAFAKKSPFPKQDKVFEGIYA